MQGRISASIVIYKSNLLMLKKAVESFLNSTDESILYLIDNSPENTVENLFCHPRIRYTFNNKNVGFGTGHNMALKKVLHGPEHEKPTYHLVLNPDVYFDPGVIEKLFRYMEASPQVGLIMPKVLYPDGQLQPLCKLLPSPFTLFRRRFFPFLPFYPSIAKKLNYLYEMHFSGYDKIMDVPFLSGCFMFLRLETLKEVGMFDESIFLFTEDVDLTRRIHQRYRTIFYPDACIYHYHQRGSYRNTTMLMHHVFSAITYFNKWGWFTDDERELINHRILLNFAQ